MPANIIFYNSSAKIQDSKLTFKSRAQILLFYCLFKCAVYENISHGFHYSVLTVHYIDMNTKPERAECMCKVYVY